MAEKEKPSKPRSRWAEGIDFLGQLGQAAQLGTPQGAASLLGKLGVNWLNTPSAGEKARFDAEQKKAQSAAVPPALVFDTGTTPAAQAPGTPDFNSWARAIIQQETGGQYGLTSSAGAQGIGQVMPATAEALAKQAGIKWRPELMTGTSTEAKDYQDQITALALEDAWKQGGQNPAGAAKYYFGGPDPAQHGPKTEQYVQDILGRLGMATAAPGNPFVSRGVPFVDPAAAMSMIPMPAAVPKIDLPDAPVLAADPARSQYKTADKDVLLAELTKAMQLPQVDEAARQKDLRFGDIQGAIQGALIGLAGGPLGVLIGAGLGGLNSHSSGRRGQLAEDKLRSERAREAAIALATQGLNLDLGNLNIENKNLDQAFLTDKNKVDTSNTNALNANQRLVEEMLQNSVVDRFNVAAKNDASRTRASVGISALEGAAAAQGRANQTQQALDAAALTYNTGGKGLETRANQILTSVGVAPERLNGSKPDANLDNVRNTAYAVAAGNVEGALGGLAQEIVSTGLAKDVLGESDAKAVEKALRENNIAAATQIVANALNANKAAAATLSDELATRGLTTAKIISGNRKRADSSAGQQQPNQAAR